jgi:hypothetical protein
MLYLDWIECMWCSVNGRAINTQFSQMTFLFDELLVTGRTFANYPAIVPVQGRQAVFWRVVMGTKLTNDNERCLISTTLPTLY